MSPLKRFIYRFDIFYSYRIEKAIGLALIWWVPFELSLAILERKRCNHQVKHAFRVRWERKLKFLSPEKRTNRVLMLRLLRQLPVLDLMEETIRSDRDCVLAAATLSGSQLRFADVRFRNDKEIVVAALKSDIGSENFIDRSLLDDKEVFLTAMRIEHDCSLTNQFRRCDWYDRTRSTFKADEDVIALEQQYRVWRRKAETWLAER